MSIAPRAFDKPAALTPGFDDLTHQSQQTFRKILAAMAEPGTLQHINPIQSPAPLSSAAYQVCLTLMDQETPLWIEPTLGSEAVLSAIRFHCGCRLTKAARHASFALIGHGAAENLCDFDAGTHDYPDRSATIIVEVDSLNSDGGWRLTGPGIAGSRQVGIVGFDQAWQSALAQNHARFPLGVDLLLTSGTTLMALPRTTRCEQLTREVTSCT